MHRAGIIHRDIKPDNVILLKAGGLRLVDLGVARVPLLEDFPAEDIPGTPSYMAPELFGGRPGDEFSDLYALGVTVYRMFTAAYPYGEIEPFSRPRFGKPASALPLSPRPAGLAGRRDRQGASTSIRRNAMAMSSSSRTSSRTVRCGRSRAVASRRSLYERDPLIFWKSLSAGLIVLVILLLAWSVRH